MVLQCSSRRFRIGLLRGRNVAEIAAFSGFSCFFLQIDGRMDGRIETQCYKKVEIS